MGGNFCDSWVNQLPYASSKSASSVAFRFLSAYLCGYTSVKLFPHSMPKPNILQNE